MVAARMACVLSLGLLGLVNTAALAQTDPPPVPDQASPSQVLVEGKRPGPGFWKVSKDGHVMWVFGMTAPLPAKMEWDDSRIDRLIGQSQEVLTPPGVSVGVGWLGGLKAVAALPSLIGAVKNPDGAELRQLVPAADYARWTVLKAKYIGEDDGIERYRPFFAAERLTDAAMKKSGLSNGIEVRKQISGIAKKHNVKLTSTGVSISLEEPGRLLKDFKQSQMEDVACFSKTLDSFEVDIDAMRARANAWANGNIAEIGNLDHAEREGVCTDAFFNSPAAKKHPAFQNFRERRLASWLTAAEKALANNASTVAVLQMSDILGPKSYLAALQAKGYTVENPK